MPQTAEVTKSKTDLIKVELLNDYWPTEEELSQNSDQIAIQPTAIPSPTDPGVAINTEPRFRAGTSAHLSVNSAFRLVEQGKAKRLDW